MKFLFFLSMLVTVVSVAQQTKPLRFLEETHDFGFVDQDGGPVSYSFQFTNGASRPVKIVSVKASCGCTTPAWTEEPVAPGETGFIQARFDPTGRPGFFSKSLTVTTDFDTQPLVLQIKGQVSGGSVANQRDFRVRKGNYLLKTSSLNLGKVLMTDTFTPKEFPVINDGTQPIQFLNADAPDHIRVEVIPPTLAPGAAGKIRLGYNGGKKGQYGFQSDHVTIHTDDASEPSKSFSVYATMEEFFAPPTRAELLAAPVLSISQVNFDFGKIKKFTPVQRELALVNTGKSVLKIRAVQPNCQCIAATLSSSEIKPGQQATLTIVFDPQDRLGTQQKSVMVYANDPSRPVQRVVFNAYVED